MRVIPPIDITPATFTRASTGTYLRHDGALVTAAVDEPRWNYGYAEEPNGRLLNLVPYSENFTTWVSASASVVSNAIAGPYPGKLAAKIVEAVSAVTTHYIYLTSGNAVVGQQVTLWAVVKPAERAWFMVRFLAGGAFPTTRFSYINAQTLAVSNGTGSVGSATPLSDGFVLVAITATAEGTGVVLPSIFLADAANNSYAGDGVSGAYIARAQINLGPVPQDYIETNDEFGYTPPAWVFKGLLQESAATNLCLQSQTLGTAPWAGSVSAVVSANAWNGVPFYTLAKTLGITSESRSHQIVTSVAAGGSLTVTVALLAGSVGTLQVGLYDGSGWGVGNATAEVLEGPGVILPLVLANARPTVVHLSTTIPTLIRLTRTYTAATSSAALFFYPGTSSSSTIGHSILATRVQVVTGLTNGGSYMPTVAVTVTRAADVMGTGMISSIPEPDSYVSELTWAGGTAYTVGQKVARATTHRTYQRLVAGTTATVPELDPVNWFDLQPDNKFAMFDLTDNTASVASGPIHFAVKSGLRTNSLFLGGVVGTDVQTVVEAPGIDPYTNSQNLRLRKTTGWYSYFFGGYAYRKAVALLDLPPLTTATVSVSIINTGAGGTACAAAVLGKNVFIGLAEYNAQRKARNFSTVTRDEFGKATLVKRRSIPTTQQTLWIEKELADTILEMNELLNATPAAWLGLDEPEDGYFNALQIVGVYQEFDIDVSYPNHARVNLKLEEI